MSQLPNNKVPRIGSAGERYRQQQLNLQLPKQDFSQAYCKYLTFNGNKRNDKENGSGTLNNCNNYDDNDDIEDITDNIPDRLSDQTIIDKYEEFVAIRNEVYLEVGYAKENRKLNQECYTCKREIEYSDVAVYSPKLLKSKSSKNELKNGEENSNLNKNEDKEGNKVLSDYCWHPACFVCQVCQELLVDLNHCVKDGYLYCERHFAETFKSRCSNCDELIFANEYTKAMNKDWHNGHFTCKNCNQSLTGKRYIVKDENQYCLKCYEELFSNYCKECKLPIGTDSKDISYKDKHWHEKCFVCALCKSSLVDKTFASRDDKIYCTTCYDIHFSSHCDGCGEVFKPGTKKMEYKGQQWHEKCFCCGNCKMAIGTKSFIPKDNRIYCLQCYEDKFATRCAKCQKVISANGVTYKNQPYHKECFLCTNCSLPLAGQKFACKDEKPYCTNCFAELFAKRCFSCQNPITGTGGTKFVSFEDRNWHNECFKCSTCKITLVGKGFINDGPDILCPECAKSKLQAKLSA
ncbi:four and a half LIM domains protein 2-like isoform X2 [Gordionus sp. m RMFG-2023]